MDTKFQSLIDRLRKNGFSAEIFNSSLEVKEKLLNIIEVEDSVGIGGSMTIDGLKIYEDLLDRGNKVFWHWKAEDKKQELDKAKNTKVYLSSSNAITMDGKIVNKDGMGNRVASLIYGHEQVYIVIGKNKICQDYKEAINRIETLAAPKNALRLDLKTPCRYTGKCSDCNSPDRMCNVESVLHKKPSGTNISIFIVNENLGY